MQNRRKVLSATRPSHLLVSDKPPRLGGKVRRIPIQEFEQSAKISFDESVYVDNSVSFADKKFGKYFMGEASQYYHSIEHYLAGSQNHLLLSNMGQYGYGVFAARRIPAGAIVSIYSGTIVSKADPQLGSDECVNYSDAAFRYSCRYNRGYAAFMQHLPEETHGETAQEHADYLNDLDSMNNVEASLIELNVELLGMTFSSPEIRASVATHTVQQIFITYQSIPIVGIQAIRDIEEGEQIGLSYGYTYWTNRKISPTLFNHQGAEISRLNYLRTFGVLRLPKGETFEGDFRPLIEDIRTNNPTLVPYFDREQKQHLMRTSKVVLRLFELNAVRLVQNGKIDDLPKQVDLMADDKSVIKSFTLTTKMQKEFLHRLLCTIDEKALRKLAFKPVFELAASWVIQVHKHESENSGLKNLALVAQALDISLPELLKVCKDGCVNRDFFSRPALVPHIG